MDARRMRDKGVVPREREDGMGPDHPFHLRDWSRPLLLREAAPAEGGSGQLIQGKK